MREGWNNDDYLIVFADDEIAAATDAYGIAIELPGFSVVGLHGWDDLIVRDAHDRLFTVPAVPCTFDHLEPYTQPALQVPLQADPRFLGKIKWYVTPLIFGGNPSASENLVWVTHEQHASLVRWWNGQYRAARNQGQKPQ